MPFDVTCPDCAKRVEMPDRVRGRRVRCRDCLAEFVAEPPRRTASRERAEAGDDDYLPDPPRGEFTESTRTPWALLGVVAAVVLVVAVGAVLFVSSRGKAPEQASATGADPTLGEFGPAEIPFDTWDGRIGNVKGAKPPVTTPDPVTGLAFRLPMTPDLEAVSIGFPPQPSKFVGVSFLANTSVRTTFAAVVDRTTARAVGKRRIAGHGRAPVPGVSPDGGTLTLHNDSNGDTVPDIQVMDALSGDIEKQPFVPYVGQTKQKVPDTPPGFPKFNLAPGQGLSVDLETALAWHAWVGPNRLLTIDGQSRADVWEMPARRPVLTIPGVPRTGLLRHGLTGSIGASRGGNYEFAVRPDGRRFAAPRNGTVVITDTATGNVVGATAPHPTSTYRNVNGIAYSPDGTHLAYTFSRDEGGVADALIWLRVVTGTTGVTVTQSRIESLDGAIVWWGHDHVVSVDATAQNATVHLAQTGKVVARLACAPTGAMRLDGRDGMLWAIFGPTERRGAARTTTQYVCAYTLPPRVKAGGGKTFRVTPDGIE
jgi:hypothetical protein